MFKEDFKLFFRFLKFILPYRKQWLGVLFLSGLGGLLNLVNPYLTKLVVDKAIGNKDIGLFIVLGVIGGTVFILSALIGAAKSFLDRRINIRVGFDLNRKVYTKLQHLPLRWFADKSTGEHIYKMSYDVGRVKDFITTAPPQSVAVIPRFLFTLAIIFYLNWQMAVFSLLLAPLLYLSPYYFGKKMRRVWDKLSLNSQGVFKNLNEVFSHIHLVKAFSKEHSSIRGYLKKLIVILRLEAGNIRLEIAGSFITQAISKLIVGLIALYGTYQVIKGRFTLGTLTAVMAYLVSLMGLQGQFTGFFQTIISGMVSCRRLAGILDKKDESAENNDAKHLLFKNPRIIFQGVSFGYHPGEYVLRGVDFTIGKGFIALAGPSGCGKSTILNLILRLYEPLEGDIFIEGNNLRELRLSFLREQIGIVLQEPFLWNASIEDNIMYAKKNAMRRELLWAAEAAGVSEFVSKLPNGYASIIGENACKISEGQKQKIAIARALIKRPKILILDEAMSAMDSLSEEKIIKGIRDIEDIYTVIVVSHRLSTVREADMVYFLRSRDKMIVDKPRNLLDKDKEFYNLFSAQIDKTAAGEKTVNFPAAI